MSMFADLKQPDPSEFWEEIKPEVTQVLEQLNFEVFKSEWRIVSPYSSLFLPNTYPPMSSHGSVGLHRWMRTFIAVCPEQDGKTIRIYGRCGEWAKILRNVEYKNFVITLKVIVEWILDKQG